MKLKLDHNQKGVQDAFGITDERVTAMNTALNAIRDADGYSTAKISVVLETLATDCKNSNELTFFMFTLGRILTESACPLHKGDTIDFFGTTSPPLDPLMEFIRSMASMSSPVEEVVETKGKKRGPKPKGRVIPTGEGGEA